MPYRNIDQAIENMAFSGPLLPLWEIELKEAMRVKCPYMAEVGRLIAMKNELSDDDDQPDEAQEWADFDPDC